MKLLRSSLIVTAIALSAVIFIPTADAKAPSSPRSLVVDLYRQHNRRRGPFYQTKSKPVIEKYFEKTLAGMIWKDLNSSSDEVGAIDGDMLYDAQDFEIRKFVLSKAKYENGKAEVTASFENFGKKNSIVFVLIPKGSGWKIEDIKYADGRTLVGLLRELTRQN